MVGGEDAHGALTRGSHAPTKRYQGKDNGESQEERGEKEVKLLN
jgi:hypothetical protein